MMKQSLIAHLKSANPSDYYKKAFMSIVFCDKSTVPEDVCQLYKPNISKLSSRGNLSEPMLLNELDESFQQKELDSKKPLLTKEKLNTFMIQQ